MSDLTSANKTLTMMFQAQLILNSMLFYKKYEDIYNERKAYIKLSKLEFMKKAYDNKWKNHKKRSFLKLTSEFREFWFYIESDVYPLMIDICDDCGSILGVIEQ